MVLRSLLSVCLAALSTCSSLAQASEPPANEIMRKVASANIVRAARLHSYRSTRVYEVDYKGFGGDRHATMTVTISYEAGKKSFVVVKEDGSKLLLNRVIRKALESEQEATTDDMRRRSELSERNYTFESAGTEKDGDKTLFLLKVTPKRKDKYLYDGKLWIDSEDYAVARIEASPAKNPSFWITSATISHTNQSFHGIWLPAKNLSTSKVRFGGRAVLTIDYGNYDSLIAD